MLFVAAGLIFLAVSGVLSVSMKAEPQSLLWDCQANGPQQTRCETEDGSELNLTAMERVTHTVTAGLIGVGLVGCSIVFAQLGRSAQFDRPAQPVGRGPYY